MILSNDDKQDLILKRQAKWLLSVTICVLVLLAIVAFYGHLLSIGFVSTVLAGITGYGLYWICHH